MWDTVLETSTRLSHDLPCPHCGHGGHRYLPCDRCDCHLGEPAEDDGREPAFAR